MSWIRTLRQKAGFNQEELAARLQLAGANITRSSVSAWETGRNKPDLMNPSTRKALSKVFKLTESEIIKLAGIEGVSSAHTEHGERAANIVDQLPPEKRIIAVRILEQLLDS